MLVAIKLQSLLIIGSCLMSRFYTKKSCTLNDKDILWQHSWFLNDIEILKDNSSLSNDRSKLYLALTYLKGQPHRKRISKKDLPGRQPHRKMTLLEDDFKGTQPQRKTTSKEDNLTGRTSQEDDLIFCQSHWKTA